MYHGKSLSFLFFFAFFVNENVELLILIKFALIFCYLTKLDLLFLKSQPYTHPDNVTNLLPQRQPNKL